MEKRKSCIISITGKEPFLKGTAYFNSSEKQIAIKTKTYFDTSQEVIDELRKLVKEDQSVDQSSMNDFEEAAQASLDGHSWHVFQRTMGVDTFQGTKN